VTAIPRTFVAELPRVTGSPVAIRGWVVRFRTLAKTTFVIVRDCTGQAQCVAATASLHGSRPKIDDAVEIQGTIRLDERAPGGLEIDITHATVLNHAAHQLPFTSSSDVSAVAPETLMAYRALSLRNDHVGNIFRVQAAILKHFRDYLTSRRFTEIVSSKIVSGGTEGGTNLFEIKYFDRVAYLAQSPQFYKEHGVAGFERVFETGHVYRAEPHATSRHLTEYYSLDFEMGFIDGPEDVIQLERELLTYIFDRLNAESASVLGRYRKGPLPSMMTVPIWTFRESLERLKRPAPPATGPRRGVAGAWPSACLVRGSAQDVRHWNAAARRLGDRLGATDDTGPRVIERS
jgi:nondiscriminating aspartyl-tRNA synthetase